MNRIINVFVMFSFTAALIAGAVLFTAPHSALALGSGGGDGGCCGGSSAGNTGGYNGNGYTYTYTPPTHTYKAPTCTLSASNTSINQGQSVTLTWSSANASSGYLTNVGTINKSGSTSVSPNYTTTYTATFYGQNGGQVSCSKTITVTTPTPVCPSGTTGTYPNCAIPTPVCPSGSTGNYPVCVATNVICPSGTTGSYPNCIVNTNVNTNVNNNVVNVNVPAQTYQYQQPQYVNPTCSLTASQNYVGYNQPVTLNWVSSNASYGWLNQGLGTIAVSGSRVVYPTQTTTYTATFTGQNGQSISCSATVNLNTVYQNPTPYVTLSAVPYTGLDLGPVGTTLYWGFLVLWCVLAAYLIAVKRIHMSIYRWYSTMLFGSASVARNAHVATVSSVRTATAAPQTDAVDSFILSQINRSR